MAKGIHHLGLVSCNFEESIKFYTEALGFKLRDKWGTPEKTIAFLEMDNGACFEVFSNGVPDEERLALKQSFVGKENPNEIPSGKAGSFPHVAVEFDDVQAMYERAIEFGAVPTCAPKIIYVGANKDIKIEIAFVFGPDAELIEIFKEYR